METLEKLQKQLSTLGDLRSIVRTMKALSAASIRQYEQAVLSLESYTDNIDRALHVVVKDSPTFKRLNHSRRSEQTAAIVFGSDHGLCGRFNETITEFSLEHLNARADGFPTKVMTVGARVSSTFEHMKVHVDEQFTLPSSTPSITNTVEEILLSVDRWRHQHQVEKVILFYNHHTKAQGYEPVMQTVLPIDLERFRQPPQGDWKSNSLPIYSMQREKLLSKLIHQYLFVSLFRACAESQASEHASRLSAMKSAQRNLDDRLSDVTKEYRHARQTEITSELLDIVTGFETIMSDPNNRF